MGDIDVEALYRRYGPMVIRRCRSMLKDEELAFDASQEVFMKIWQSRERIKNDSISSLLLRIATNTCLNKLRTIKRLREKIDEDILASIADPENIERGIIARLKLERIFSREHTSTRMMAVMHYHDGMTLEQVAKEVGLSVSGVRKRLRNLRYRARALEGKL